MPRNATIMAKAKAWTELTSADVTAISVQNQGPGQMYLQRSGISAPLSKGGSKMLMQGWGISAAETLDNLWPGASGGRVWAWVDTAAPIQVSHA